MGTTAHYKFPYPEGTSPADGPFAVRTLANAIEAKVQELFGRTSVVGAVLQSRPMLRQRRVTPFTVPNSTETPLLFDRTDFDTIGSPRPDGWYLVSWGAAFDPGTVGIRRSSLRINSALHPLGMLCPSPVTTAGVATAMGGKVVLVRLIPADVLGVSVFQDSGGGLNLYTGTNRFYCHLTVVHLSAAYPANFAPQ